MTYEFDLHESKEEGRAEGMTECFAQIWLEIIDARFANPKLNGEDIFAISDIPQDEIETRRVEC